MTSLSYCEGIVSLSSKPKVSKNLILTWIDAIYEFKRYIIGIANNREFIVVSGQLHSPIICRNLKIKLGLNNALKVKYIPKRIARFGYYNRIKGIIDRHPKCIVILINIFKYIVERKAEKIDCINI